MVMEKCEELEHLRKRKTELRTIANNLEDIRGWLEKNGIDMVTNVVCYDQELRDAIESIEDIVIELDDSADEIEEELSEDSNGN